MISASLARLQSVWALAIAPPPDYTPSQWAEANLDLPETVTEFPGLIDLDLTPFARQPIDDFADADCESITIVAAPQVCKTTVLEACLGYAIDHDPGPALFVIANQDLAKSFSKTKLQPVIDSSPALARHKPSNPDKYGMLEMAFDRMTLNLAGGNSPAGVSSRPIRYLFLDECDKYKAGSERETSIEKLAVHRTRTYRWSKKILRTSSPTVTTGPVWVAYLAGDQREWLAPCPKCKKGQALKSNQLRFPDRCKTDGLWNLEAVRDSAWYECEHCGAKITDQQKGEFIAKGKWVASGQWSVDSEKAKSKSPRLTTDHCPLSTPPARHRSYRIPAALAPWVTFGDWAAAWCETQNDPRPEVLHDFANGWDALPYEAPGESAGEDEILQHRADYQPNTCPVMPDKIIMTVDVQHACFYYVIRAWAGAVPTSWLLRYGIAGTWAEIAALARCRFRVADAASIGTADAGSGRHGWLDVTNVMIDSGDQTEAVYEACRLNRWMPSKGYGGDRYTQPYKFSKLPNGQGLMLFSGEYFKEALQRRIRIKLDDPGAWLLHADTGLDYARQLAGEKLVEKLDPDGRVKREWVVVGANHYLDCEVMQLVARTVLPIGSPDGTNDDDDAADNRTSPRKSPNIRRPSSFSRLRR